MQVAPCLDASCAPVQILTIEMPVNDVGTISILNHCGQPYDKESLKYSYSVDGVCWSCYMSFTDVIDQTLDTVSDYFVRAKVPGAITKVTIGDEETGYSVTLDSSFTLPSCDNASNTNMYNPYANMDCALQLQTALSESVACMIGIPIYYFKVDGVDGAADMTFKEYALKSVRSVKQIKLVITDGQMPSSKPEFADFGLDWQTDWETEISKNMFATAFGINAQPTEGDLVYIPMQKRMWMVNEAYDERNGSLMWQSTTWKVALTKYQSDGSLDLNGTDDFVATLVKNDYEDIFGNEEPLDSGVESVPLTKSRPVNMYSVFKSDSTRYEMTCDTIDFQSTTLYHKGTLVMDNCYRFLLESDAAASSIVYQRPWCGDELSLSFIIRCNAGTKYETCIIEIGNLKLILSQDTAVSTLRFNQSDKGMLKLNNGTWYFVTLRFSRTMRTFDMSAAEYKYPDGIPLYKLTAYHYYFDVDNCQQISDRWNQEMQIGNATKVILNGFFGNISNIKVMDVYDDRLSELMMQYPTHQHLLINDTARPLYGLLGTTQK